MTTHPRLSIGLPVYNGEEYLAEAFDALLGQTYEDFELVVSDNASTDGTQDICRKYAARDSRIRYIRLPRNIGAAPSAVRAAWIARRARMRAAMDLKIRSCWLGTSRSRVLASS